MEQVAIVGMAAFFPGAANLDAYWRNLTGGVDSITDVPADRWDAEFYDPANGTRPDRLYCRRGGFVRDEATFEPLKFGIMPNSVPDIEPDQLIALDVASAAIDDAGGAAKMPDGDKVGVFLGRGGILSPAQSRFAQRVRMPSQVVALLRDLVPEIDEKRLDMLRDRFDEEFGNHQPEGTIGLVPNLAASRVANRLNLRGPAYTIDAACASSLLAVDQGIAELSSGRLDAVLAGGVHHVHDISFWSVFNQLRALSRQGEIRPFDATADGLLIGEGTGIVVLKRLADAVRDGDRVYAVIRGSGTSSDGRSASMFNPATSGQVLAMRRAWEAAGLDPRADDALGLLEAHGTATPTGDAAELTSLGEVFGPYAGGTRPVIGSVKSMIGHTMPAAGVAGLIKAALAVHHGVLPPTLHCDTPRAEMAGTRFAPIAAAKPWQSDGPRRAGVNAFGFGGINAHVIIEQYVSPASVGAGRPARPNTDVAEPDQVLWLAADDPAGISALLDRDDDAVRALGAERAAHAGDGTDGPARLGIVDPTTQRLAAARRMVARGEAWRGGRDIWFSPRPLLGPGAGKLAFVFPGVEAEFAPQTADIAAHFGLPHREWTDADLGQHGTGLVEVGTLLDTALHRMGVVPDAVAGHSIGEWTAAAVTGQMSTAGVDSFLGVFKADSVEVSGYAFAAVSAGAPSVTPLLADYPGVVLSHDNAPAQCVVNGPAEQVRRLVDDLRARNVLCQLLPFRSAFHTPVFAAGLQAIGAALGRWEVHTPSVPVWSGTLAAPMPTDPDEVNQLFIRHMIEPVWFQQTVNAMYDAGFRVFLQMGAGQLASLIDDNLRGRDHLAMAVNVSRRSGLDQLRRVATALWVDGGTPDLRVLDPAASASVPAAPAPVALADPSLRDTPAGPAAPRPPIVSQVAGPAQRRGPAIRLDLGGPLVRLGAGASELLGLGATGPDAARGPAVNGAARNGTAGSNGHTPGVVRGPAATAPGRPTTGPQGYATPPAPRPTTAPRPAAQTRAAQAATPQRPTAQAPAGQIPAAQIPAAQIPAAQISAGRAPAAQTPASVRPAAQVAGPPPAAAAPAARPGPSALDALQKMAGTSKAAAELAALLQETARHAVTVMDAASATTLPRQRTAPAPAPTTNAPATADGPATSGPATTQARPAVPVQPRPAPAAQPLPPVPAQVSAPGAAPHRPADGAVTRSVLSVSIEDMPYLLDHCFFVQPDDWPNPEDRWPVVPATTVVQHMMDAATQAAPGMRAVGVRDAKFNRWLIAAPPQKVDITVKPAGPGLLSVIFGGYAKATVEMAADYPADSPDVWVHDPATEFPPTISAEQMYTERLMFHGPQFQGVTTVHALGDMHVRGVVTAPVPPGALLDNALQLIGNWLITTQPFRTVALPVGLGHVRFFGPPPAPGTAFECVARVRTIDDAQLVAGTQLIVDGRVWVQIDDAVDRRFDSHPTARPAERFPEKFPMSAYQPEGWTMAFDAWTDLVTRGMAARGILGGVAATEYERMPAAKRKQWMLGRIAAKDAVRFRQWEAGHTDVYPIELTVVNEASGRPRVVLRPGRGLVECDVSLAHTAEVGVAIAHPLTPGTAVGIDVVELAPRDDTTVRYALSADESALLDSLGDRDLWFTRFWAAKEAVGKARGTGLDGRPRQFTVRAADPAGLVVTVGDQTYRVGFREVDNPPELPPRRYVVAWTWGPSAESTHR